MVEGTALFAGGDHRLGRSSGAAQYLVGGESQHGKVMLSKQAVAMSVAGVTVAPVVRLAVDLDRKQRVSAEEI